MFYESFFYAVQIFPTKRDKQAVGGHETLALSGRLPSTYCLSNLNYLFQWNHVGTVSTNLPAFLVMLCWIHNGIFILLQVIVLNSTSLISLFLRIFQTSVLKFSKQKVTWKENPFPDQWHTWVNRFTYMKFALRMSHKRLFWQEMRLASDFQWRFELKQCVFT